MTQHIVKVDSADHERIDIYLVRRFPDYSRSFVKRLIDGGHVKVDEHLVKAHHKVAPGEEIIVDIPKDFLAPQYVGPQDIKLDIFYEDDYLIIINKPSGMLVHPASGQYTDTLVNALLHHSIQLSTINAQMRPGIVHRLDQDTSGLMVVAKDNITHTKLAKQFQRHHIFKQYAALVEGRIEFDEGVVNAPIGRDSKRFAKKTVDFSESAKEAFTRYRVIKRAKDVTLVALFPKTGRTHQLRVHMAHLGHPILGDDKYGRKSNFPRLALHARAIGFKHPHYQSYIEFSTPLPEEFLKRVSKH